MGRMGGGELEVGPPPEHPYLSVSFPVYLIFCLY